MPSQQEEEEEEDTRKTLLDGLAKIPTANFKGINKVIAFGIVHARLVFFCSALAHAE